MVLLELLGTETSRGDFTLTVPHLSLQPGHLYTLHGRNGAGKSTLLQQLALLQKPEAGQMLLNGQPIYGRKSRLTQLRKQITLVEQNPLLFTGSIEKNLAFGLKLRGFSDKEQREKIDHALQVVGLGGLRQRSTRELSGGEVRRVALARALCLRPQLLLLDEPTASLDVGQVASLERFLVSLPEQGMTLVIATHDATQTERLGGERIVITDGILEQSCAGTEKAASHQPLFKQAV